MTQKVNGAAYPGIWVEKQVTFMKLTFNIDISAIVAANLVELGTTTPVTTGTVADSTFGVVESALVQALKIQETKSTVLGISKYDVASKSVDVMLGYAEGWFANAAGAVSLDGTNALAALPVLGAQAVITTAGAGSPAYPDAVGTLVGVINTAVTFTMEFTAFNGTMPVATAANGDLEIGPGATPGSNPTNSPTGLPGYYPVDLAAA